MTTARSSRPELDVLFRSEDFLVVDKPMGIATEPNREREPSLVDAAERLVGRRPHAVSRLDTGVSGAVLLALSDRGRRLAASAKDAALHERRYVALASGPPLDRDSAALTSPIEGRAARTRLVDLHVAASSDPLGCAQLVVLAPETGRTHQLRIHLARRRPHRRRPQIRRRETPRERYRERPRRAPTLPSRVVRGLRAPRLGPPGDLHRAHPRSVPRGVGLRRGRRSRLDPDRRPLKLGAGAPWLRTRRRPPESLMGRAQKSGGRHLTDEVQREQRGEQRRHEG